ncbi:MAG: tRNA (N6-isopentenyl adenosine(37)-C2)-methylthiotransferase MiaB [Saprospiraceae bacterium]
MSDTNSTIQGLNKEIIEEKQGEIFEGKTLETSSKFFYIESYGCAMNFSDSEIVASILGTAGYAPTKDIHSSDLLLINTCSIREKAEQTVRRRLKEFNKVKRNRPSTMIGVLGCMAERLKEKFLEEEKLVDMVVGPDAYRSLPKLLEGIEGGQKGINVLLSREETYADISPMRLDNNGVSGYISIMRGCDNMCSFCVVPFTRGRERSRNAYTIVAEAQEMYDRGYKEVNLLGQNVDSYKWTNPENNKEVTFSNLLALVAEVAPTLRIRFSTSHPKDICDDVLHTIANHDNICNYIHLPIQSGNDRVLKLMNRTYTREWYKNRIEAIRRIIPGCAISSDTITGFCTETEEEHQDTISLMKWANFSSSYMFYYSERPGTLAARKYEDDITLEVKKRRLAEVIAVQREISIAHNNKDIGEIFSVLIESNSKRSDQDYKGRNEHNKKVIFPKVDGYKPGDYIDVKIQSASMATLIGIAVNI